MSAIITRAPGRVNLIGEHTDHQKGLVMPACIDLEIIAWATPRDDSFFLVHSQTLNEADSFDGLIVRKGQGWTNYVRGVVKYFQKQQRHLKGANIWITSTIPVGSGLSSSAALEMAVLSILETIHGESIPDEEAIQLCWKAETEFVGVSCGIMDQFVIRKGRKDHALLLDCQDLSYQFVQMPLDVGLLVIDTGSPRQLTAAPYNQRIQELAIAKEQLHSAGVEIQEIGNLTPQQFAKHSSCLSNPYRQRTKHVVSENERTRKFKESMAQGNLETAGKLLYQSHASLRNNFDASWPRADALVEVSRTFDGVFGARMTGAGWGGSVMMLVEASKFQKVRKNLSQWFIGEYQEQVSVYELWITDGVSTAQTTIPNHLKEMRKFLFEPI